MVHEIKRVIIDTDPGIDDAHALMIFLEAEKRNLIKIEAITLTAGNTSLENACKNTVRLLESENRTDIPIYKGVKDALLQYNAENSTYFGIDGFGDVFNDEPNLSLIRKELSPVIISEIVNENPGRITLACLGPLTNIALAAKLNANFFDKVKECFIMGGNYQGRGNETASGEFNFYSDPEAAYIVLKTITCPTTILPIESCYKAHITLEWRRKVLGQCSKMTLLNQAEDKCYPFVTGETNSWVPADGYLAAIVLYPEEIVKQKSEQHVTVELRGLFTRGQMVLDHLKNNKANVLVVEELDVEFYKNIVLDMFKD